MEKEPNLNNPGKGQLAKLADKLEDMLEKKTSGQEDIVMQKLIRFLRIGDAYATKIFLGNESDKFTQYREDAIPLIIKELYGGSGSPWFTIERKLKAGQSEKKL
jgi:hypothetical protein